MAEYGLTNKGFKRKRYIDILQDKESRARELFGENVNLSERSPMGLFIRLNAWEESRAWQAAEDVYFASYISTAEGINLDRRAENIIIRKPATKATGEITITGDSGTDVEAGFLAETEDGIQFVTTEDVTINGGSIDAPIEAVEPGSEGNVPAATITEIVNPVAGVETVTNIEATDNGEDRETDAELRERYFVAVEPPGLVTKVIMQIVGVQDAQVRHNDTMNMVGNIPPKSIAPLVYGGDGVEIAEAIFGSKAKGIESAAVGVDAGLEVEETITDEQGIEHTIGFARPEEQETYVDCELQTDEDFPEDGTDKVEQVIIDYIDSLGMGGNVVYTRIIAEIQSIPGVTDIPQLYVDVGAFGTGQSNINIDVDQVATTDEAKVQVVEV